MSEARSYESFASDVNDQGEPNQSLDIAGQAVRDFNRRSFGRMNLDKPGWQYAPDAYRSLGELTYLAGGLPQAFEQITTALVDQLGKGLIRIDRGTPYEDHPEAAVAAAEEATYSAPSRPPSRCTRGSRTPRPRSTPPPTTGAPTTRAKAMSDERTAATTATDGIVIVEMTVSKVDVKNPGGGSEELVA